MKNKLCRKAARIETASCRGRLEAAFGFPLRARRVASAPHAFPLRGTCPGGADEVEMGSSDRAGQERQGFHLIRPSATFPSRGRLGAAVVSCLPLEGKAIPIAAQRHHNYSLFIFHFSFLSHPTLHLIRPSATFPSRGRHERALQGKA